MHSSMCLGVCMSVSIAQKYFSYVLHCMRVLHFCIFSYFILLNFRVLEKFYVGELTESEFPVFSPRG